MNARAFRLPRLFPTPTERTDTTVPAKPAAARPPLARRYFAASFALLLCSFSTAGALYENVRHVEVRAGYVGRATELQMLSQRLAKSARQAVLGEAAAVQALRDGQRRVSEHLEVLRHGDASLPASPPAADSALRQVTGLWARLSADAGAVLRAGDNLVVARDALARLDTAWAAAAADPDKADGGAAVLTARVIKNAAALLSLTAAGDAADALRDDAERLRRLGAAGTTAGSAGGAAGAESTDAALQTLLDRLPAVVAAAQAAAALSAHADDFLIASQGLTSSYQQLSSPALFYAAGFGIAALLSLIALQRVTTREALRRARQSQAESEQTQALNQRNQSAILRLLDELAELAEGDLTVKASVTEDFTGAIADSVNFAVGEMRALVGRIHGAAEQVRREADQAQGVARELSAAAGRQSQEIRQASSSVEAMARSVQTVSDSARQSSDVAQQSLAAAEQGAQAVQHSITGMHDIRAHIQDTAKRIKRLGESSQEIGEIVGLIADITEQTHVLALNAAIQAASAGEAGRGFSVVAEEVQQLAERSAQATRQIAALVKAIQADTSDAVQAMEKSTQGVVAGAAMSDAAGQALTEIGAVSRRLAGIVEGIAHAATAQVQLGQQVAKSMQDIQRINAQASQGTQQTAASVAGLARQVAELEGSVAGFKIA